MNIDNKNNQTDDLREINKFSEMASEWWDPNGKFAPLHKFNPIRQEYLVDKIKNHFSILPNGSYPFKNLTLLDVWMWWRFNCRAHDKIGCKSYWD